MAIHCEGFAGEYRSGFDLVFRQIVQLMDKPDSESRSRLANSVNIVGGKMGPERTEIETDVKELRRLIESMPSRDKNIEKVSALGVPVVEVSFTDFDSMKKCFSDTANALGDEEALERSQKYNAYLDSKLELVRNISSRIPYDERPKVLHLVSLSPLCVDGGGNIISDWIEAAGGVNAAEEVKGGIMQEVSMEQILKWNPDVIILSVNAKSEEKEKIMNSESWKKVKAVQNNKVFVNPEGAFIWSRAGAEQALQIQWAAKTINPDMFQSIDMNNETKWFYKTFFDYELTDEDVQKILNAQAPD